jgi:hypothetical protein
MVADRRTFDPPRDRDEEEGGGGQGDEEQRAIEAHEAGTPGRTGW